MKPTLRPIAWVRDGLTFGTGSPQYHAFFPLTGESVFSRKLWPDHIVTTGKSFGLRMASADTGQGATLHQKQP